jgi:hypothetical protein
LFIVPDSPSSNSRDPLENEGPDMGEPNAPTPEKDREEDEDLGVSVARLPGEEEASDHASESVLSLTVSTLLLELPAERGEGRDRGVAKLATLIGLSASADFCTWFPTCESGAGVAAHIEERFSGGGQVKCAQKRILNDVP